MSETLNGLLDKVNPKPEEKTAEMDFEKVAEDLYLQGRIVGRGIMDEMEGVEKEAGVKSFMGRMAKKVSGSKIVQGAKPAPEAGKGAVTHRIDRINNRLAAIGTKASDAAGKAARKMNSTKLDQKVDAVSKTFKHKRNWGAASVAAGGAIGGAGVGAGISALKNKQS